MNKSELQAIFDEAELNIKALNDPKVTENAYFDALKAIYDLVVLLNNSKEYENAYKLAEYIRPRVKKLCEYTSGMNFRELCDVINAENSFRDARYDLYWHVVLEQSFYNFESFMWYMERKRPFEKKFYEPRAITKQGKKALKLVADELQKLEFRVYRKLAISMPSRVGKSTIFIFYLVWKALRSPNSHNAYGGYSGVLAKGFYKEIMNLVTSCEYCYEEIYTRFHPANTFIQDKSAEDLTVTLDEPSRFATITCRGIDGSWTGIIDVSNDGVLAVDDLVRDREESMSPQRMEKIFQEYLNKMVDRMNTNSQECLIGTLWGVLDPIERLRIMYEGNPLYKFLRIPALDENDESNFDYLVNGFTTEYYREMRSRLDKAEWMAKFQQQPFVREGLLFPQEELRFFDGIVVKKEIKRVFAVTDPSFGGGDNLSTPICYELTNGRRLICGWIFDKRTVAYTIPRVVKAMYDNDMTEMRLEKNGAGLLLEKNIRDEMVKQNVHCCKVLSVSAPNRMSKEDKIKGYSDYIKENFEFISPAAEKPEIESDDILFFGRDADYQRAMDDLCFYTAEGKNIHDDAADSMAQLAIMCEKKTVGQVKVLHIPEGFGI